MCSCFYLAVGKTANHAAVMARLYTKGKYRGIHLFIVQIRDLITHMPMPGMEEYLLFANSHLVS